VNPPAVRATRRITPPGARSRDSLADPPYALRRRRAIGIGDGLRDAGAVERRDCQRVSQLPTTRSKRLVHIWKHASSGAVSDNINVISILDDLSCYLSRI